jgi:cytidylate kinase
MTIVAIDGPVASGKSSVARAVAAALGYTYLDTGAMYRAIGVLASEAGVPLDDEDAVVAVVNGTALHFDEEGRLFANGRDVSAAIRTLAAGAAASRVSVAPAVRALLVEQQRALARAGDVVMEGRDIGTNVFPNAEVKIYLTAHPEVRAARRVADLRNSGEAVEHHEVLAALHERDRRDTEREVAPLRRAADAVEIDTSEMTWAEVVEAVVELVEVKVGARQ